MINFLPIFPIFPGLFLGSAVAAKDLSWLRAMGIGAILNVTRDNRSDNLSGEEFSYQQVAIAGADVDIVAVYEKDVEAKLLRWLNEQNKRVLVHCEHGRSRYEFDYSCVLL